MVIRSGTLFLPVLVSLTLTTNAQDPQLVLDINPGTSSSSPSRYVELNGDILFIASTPATGAELWRTDGTSGGTQLVKDIWPGTSPSYLKGFSVIDGTLYFSADDGVHGAEVWRSDGTETGTMMIKDINPISNNGLYPGKPIGLDGIVYFRAGQPDSGYELWRSDGTEAGTSMVKDINPGSASSTPSQMAVVNGQLLFWARVDTNDWALWRSDGTEDGTVLVSDVKPGAAPNVLKAFYEVDGIAYFFGADTIYGGELWRTDGTGSGTWMVKDIRAGVESSSISDMRVLGDRVIFSAHTEGEGREFWLSDGTEQGTNIVTDLNPGPENGVLGMSYPVVVDGWLYYAGKDGSSSAPFGLYITNGTDTYLVTDELGGMGSLSPACGGVFFDGSDGIHGWELWYSNGTTLGTRMVADMNTGSASSYPHSFLETSDMLIFSARVNTYGEEPWILPCTAVHIEEISDTWKLTIAPVPASNHVYIDLPDNKRTWELNVIDALGRNVYNVQRASGIITIDISRWNRGSYLVVARGSEGMITGRLLVQ